MKKLIYFSIFFAILGFSFQSYSQNSGIKGKVTDEYDEPLVGTSIIEKGTTNGGVSDVNGKFQIDLSAGSKTIIISYLGYDPIEIDVQIEGGNYTNMGTVKLQGSIIGLGSIDIVADRAKERETPVAISNISKTELEARLGSQDIPMILNATPSVYATMQGGGSGDARINVRGFDQRNVSIMINGVPVNDMENGWVYWSNWDGIADATSSIQMQRGLSAVNLAAPSVGGTMNVITSPADHKAGASGKFEYGSGNFMKTTISGHTGLLNDKYAISATMVRKVGEGVIDGTWTDAWAYYFGASYILNEKNRLEIFALGAPQRHGQNSYMQNVAAYSHDYAKEIGADDSTLLTYAEANSGRFYNENWNTIDTNYNGKQFWNGKERERYDKGFINERENYYHKPLVNLNWYSKWSSKLTQFTTVYYSGGKGGGSGTLGSLRWDYSGPSRIVDWDATVERNSQTDTARGILRNSLNDQWTIGALSKVRYEFSENLKASVGIDWRTAEVEHNREVRDLLGGKFYVFSGNDFDTPAEYNKVLGDKVDYNFTNTINWFGYFAQAEYSNDLITAYGTFGSSLISYKYVNHFTADPNDATKELSSETDPMMGWQLKGGLSYRPTSRTSVFANVGLISKAPIFDAVIDDRSATVAADPQNENFTAFEFGGIYLDPENALQVSANMYYTLFSDRTLNFGVINQDGSEGFVFIQGLAQKHLGFEMEASYKPFYFLQFDLTTSVGNWEYTDNVTGTYKDYSSGAEVNEEYEYYVKGLKVGNAPQMQFRLGTSVFPIEGLKIQVDYRFYGQHYAGWDPTTRTDATDTEQVWQAPDYMLFDLHASYKMGVGSKYFLEVFAHVFNMFDKIYIQDATDNSAYNGFYGYDNRFSHTVNSAEVFLGLPRTFNAGLKLSF